MGLLNQERLFDSSQTPDVFGDFQEFIGSP